ncbi:LCP family protein [Laceyella putida]|uniref:LCP family protein n=1 Tax=Laceyella putida TaxID=110101 RepID=A0ABW2RGB8_9BACL
MQKVRDSRIDRVKQKRRKKWVFRITTIVTLLVLGFGLYFGSQIWGVFANSNKDLKKSDLREKEVEIKNDPFTVLLLGTDQRTTRPNDWRADVMILAAVNPKTKTVKVVSVPRDTYITIPNSGGVKTKINAAAYYGRQSGVGDVENVRKTLEELLHVPVDYYARINFQGFEDIVDALGGIQVTPKFKFTQAMIGGGYAKFYPGNTYTLNGKKALAYVRERHEDPRGDLGRNERQREVVSQLIDKMASFQGVTKFSEVSKAVGKNFEYSFEVMDFPALVKVYQGIPKQNIETIQIKVYDDKIPGVGAVLRISEEEKQRIRKILQQQLEYKPKEDQLKQVNSDGSSTADNSGSDGN